MKRFVSNLTMPPGPYDVGLAEFAIAIVPAALAALEGRCGRWFWASDEDWRRGEQAIRGLQVALLLGDSFGEKLDRLYRLIDHIHTGTVYTVENPDPMIITPAIPDVPSSTPATPDSLLGLLRGLPGVLDAGWFGIGGRPATLADIVNALRASAPETTTTLFEQARDLLNSTSDVAAIGNFAAGILDEGTDVVGDAGTALMIALLAASQTAMSQQLALRLDRLIASLDGGGAAPPDSVLRALRGDNPATAERNVIDALAAGGGTVTPADIDRVIAKLEEIKVTL